MKEQSRHEADGGIAAVLIKLWSASTWSLAGRHPMSHSFIRCSMSTSPEQRRRYMFIRILEACNADCFMCGYALSRDPYRFSVDEFERILPQAYASGVAFIRFTGGEPLLHKDVLTLVQRGSDAGMRMSIITNGYPLPRMIEALCRVGLSQIIVSIDGASSETHDQYRNTPGLFDRCLAGLRMGRELGIRTRVNTVVGPHNFAEMPTLQQLLTLLGIEQWELSAVKLGRPIRYPSPEEVRAVCDPIYDSDPASRLVPMGKRFYGNTIDEQRLFFDAGIMPRSSPPACNLVGDVIYIDAKTGRGFGCSLLPHRTAEESRLGTVLQRGGAWTLDTPGYLAHVEQFRATGPTVCSGCSTTAAGYSDTVARGETPEDWAF